VSELAFQGRKVLVTGASRGIGRAIAVAFAAAGAKVALVFRSDQQAAQDALAAMSGDGHCLIRADVSVPADAEGAVADCIDRLGGLDIVVNNAGIYLEHPVAEIDFECWQHCWRATIDTNLIGPANVCYAAARHMIDRGAGKIVNVSSRGAFRGEPRGPAYGASKAGLNSMSQSLAVALAPHGIFVGVVAPGFIETDMAREILDGPGGDEIRRQSPLNRVGRPDEVARAVLFLASDDIDFATGAIIDVNGASYLRS
jgi:NAD(P)-dependent dehydrogenase (short-subunit alcohol dehydrogenase family)